MAVLDASNERWASADGPSPMLKSRTHQLPFPAGAGCKLNDVWQLSLDSNLWQQLSQPYFTSKRCERLFG